MMQWDKFAAPVSWQNLNLNIDTVRKAVAWRSGLVQAEVDVTAFDAAVDSFKSALGGLTPVEELRARIERVREALVCCCRRAGFPRLEA